MNILERTVLSFPVGGRRFNYRVAGIAIRDGHVLICSEDDDDYAMLPGGRVELGEPSVLALEREMAEELALPVTIGPLIFTSESFYEREDQQFHEIAFFYRLDLPEGMGPDGQDPWLVREDEGHLLQFSWVPVTGDGLAYRRLLPAWLQKRLADLPAQTEHVVFEERSMPVG